MALNSLLHKDSLARYDSSAKTDLGNAIRSICLEPDAR